MVTLCVPLHLIAAHRHKTCKPRGREFTTPFLIHENTRIIVMLFKAAPGLGWVGLTTLGEGG